MTSDNSSTAPHYTPIVTTSHSYSHSQKLKKGRVLQAVWSQICSDTEAFYRQGHLQSRQWYNDFSAPRHEIERMECEEPTHSNSMQKEMTQKVEKYD